jgi:ubiquinone/menaquinone biosynthesis C-methylase UbiE
MNPETVAVYDSIAGSFADRHWRTRLDGHMAVLVDRLPPGGRVLDAGCGPGRDCAWLTELGFRPVGVDASTGMLDQARRRAPGPDYLRGDLRVLPLATSSVDAVWMCASLLHLARADAAAALGEARRVARTGAPLYVGVQEGRGEERRPDGRHFIYWSLPELVAAVDAAGFDVDPRSGSTSGPVTWVAVHAVAR